MAHGSRALKRAGAFVLALACLALLIGHGPSLRAQVREGEQPIIVNALAVQGNRRVQEAVILGRIQTKVGSPYVPASVTEDIRSVFVLGFFEDVQVKVEGFEGGVKLTFVVVERPFIRDIEFTGNRRIATSTLLEKIALKLGTVYNPVEVQKARDRLKDHYEEEGYFELQITPDAEKLQDGDVKVVFRITEGQRFTIDRIAIDGAKGLSEQQVKSVMQTRERRFYVLGGILHRQRLEADIERILALYHNHGYIRARVESHEITVDRTRARLRITLKVVEGPQFTVGRVNIGGTTVLPEEEVRRQIKLAPGEVFSRSRLRESVQGIADLYSAIGRACARVNVILEISDGSEVSVERITSPALC